MLDGIKDWVGLIPLSVACLALWGVFVDGDAFWLKVFILLPLLVPAWAFLAFAARTFSALIFPGGR